jgi:transposase
LRRARDAGLRSGKRFIGGDRASLRAGFFAPALVTVLVNGTLWAEYQALRAAGKTPKVAISAIMRKFLILTNAPFRDGRTGPPQDPVDHHGYFDKVLPDVDDRAFTL